MVAKLQAISKGENLLLLKVTDEGHFGGMDDIEIQNRKNAKDNNNISEFILDHFHCFRIAKDSYKEDGRIKRLTIYIIDPYKFKKAEEFKKFCRKTKIFELIKG